MEGIFRLLTLVALVGTLGVSGFHRRRARQSSETIARRRESPGLMAARLLVALPLFLSVILYVANPAWMEWATIDLPGRLHRLAWLRWMGAAMALACIPTAQWVFTTLGRNVSETVLTKRDHELVTSGPYRWVRHPLYSTGLLLFTGVGLMNLSWFLLLFAAITAAGVLCVVIPREETQLTTKFGDDYLDLVRSTGRLLPSISASRRRSKA